MKTDSDTPTLYLCDCGCGAVAVEPLDMGDDDKFICISLWQHGVDGHRSSLRDRLIYVWHIIRHGHPYTDTVLLEPELAHGLGSKLCWLAEEMLTARTEKLKRKPVVSFDSA